MDVETASKTIQLILAPVVMVSACAILLNGMLSHYQAISDRLRALGAERLGLSLVAPDTDRVAFARERLTEIDFQVPLLLRRHRQVHQAIVVASAAVVVLVLSMFVIAVAALSDSSAWGTAALFVFLGGTAILMGSASLMAMEVGRSRAAVSYESMRIVGLPVIWHDAPDVGVPSAGSPS